MKEELGYAAAYRFSRSDRKGKHTFTIEDVLEHLIYKMKRRHPHVFGEAKVKDVDGVLLNWENKGNRKR